MSPWIKHKRKGGEPVDPIPLITIRPQGIAFNAQFVASAKLADLSRATLFLDPERLRLGFEFHKNRHEEDSYTLTSDGGSKTKGGRMIQTMALFKENPWLRPVASLKDPRLKRFEPEWNSVDRKWIISLCPAFENRVSHKSEIPSDLRGIYRYRLDDAIVYIGRGVIKSRAQSPERKEWDFDVIEYSRVEDESEQARWESYWLDQHVKEFGKLPFYNRIGGKTWTWYDSARVT